MKSFLITVFLTLSTVFFSTNVHAALYPLNAIRTGSTITVTMQGAPADQTLYQLYDATNIIQVPKVATGGIVTWKLVDTEFKDNYLYTFRVTSSRTGFPINLDVTEKVYLTVGAPPTISPLRDFKIIPDGNGKVVVSGNVGSSARTDVTITFLWSPGGTATGGPTNAKPLSAGVGGQFPILEDGTYSITVPNLTPEASYYFKQEIAVKGSTTPYDTKIGTFTTEKGYLIPGSVSEELDFNSRSYHLLAPWPGLSVLMDPDLCAEKKAKGEVPIDAVCDVNGFLDFAFKLMIGLAAVVLVLRLMYEGYQYMVTDVPFLKASAKSGFKTALLGLLLALSSYVILNTINPKLVNNTISIDSIDVGVEEVYNRADDPNFMSRLDSENIQGVTADINDETFLVYLSHQQGAGGAKAILRAAKNNTPVPENITKNMSSNFNRRDAQKTIGTSGLTPINFLNYWSIRVRAFKKDPAKNIPSDINSALSKVSQETGISLITLQVMCRIESGCSGPGSISAINDYGYAGLFQLSNQIHPSKKTGKFTGKVWETYKKTDGILLNAYHNAYVGALYAKSNLSLIK